MNNFLIGFEKRSFLAQSSDQKDGTGWKSKLKSLAVPGAALAAGLGAYALKRGGGTGKRLVRAASIPTKVMPQTHQAPSKAKGWFYNQIYGADKLIPLQKPIQQEGRASAPLAEKYLNSIPKHKLQPNEVGMATHPSEGRRIFGSRAEFVGSGMTKQKQLQMSDKYREQMLLKRHAPGAGIASYSPTMKGKRGLSDIHKKMEGKGEGYFLKSKFDSDSGVGGSSFINHKDVSDFLSGKKVPKGKQKLLDHAMKNPSNYVAQPNIGIEKGVISGKSKEMRLHAINGKVVPGASSIRSGNFEDVFKKNKAEKFFQAHLDKLPEKYKKNIAMSPDIAMTIDGMKVIETNPGGMMSGLTNPLHVYRRGGVPAAANAWMNNAAIYKHITGRSTQLTSGITGLGAAGATYGAGRLLEKRIDKKKHE